MQEKNRNFSILKQRILKFLDFVGDTKKDFYTKTGISNGILSQSGGISEDNLLKFLNIYTNINIWWLFTGNGSILQNNDNEQTIIEKAKVSIDFKEKYDLLKEQIIDLQKENIAKSNKIIDLLLIINEFNNQQNKSKHRSQK